MLEFIFFISSQISFQIAILLYLHFIHSLQFIHVHLSSLFNCTVNSVLYTQSLHPPVHGAICKFLVTRAQPVRQLFLRCSFRSFDCQLSFSTFVEFTVLHPRVQFASFKFLLFPLPKWITPNIYVISTLKKENELMRELFKR